MAEEEKAPENPQAGQEAPAPAAVSEEEAGGVAVEAANPTPLEGGAESLNPAGLGLEHLLHIQVQISVMLGTAVLPIDTLLKLGPGSVITLDRGATEPVDILVDGKKVAAGEVVTIGDNYGIRVTSVKSAEEVVKALG